ncbi:MAG: hypothetical protein LBD86_03215 [Spirochaetaceae bacterium]|jgi:hypothetical protein|nr:hypothetical protein [Spirochaetaceae bacterium]
MKSVNFNFGRAAGAMLCAAAFLFFGCDTDLASFVGDAGNLKGTVEITGNLTAGKTVTAEVTPLNPDPETWTKLTKTYKWQKKAAGGEDAVWEDIEAARESDKDTFTLTSDDTGCLIGVVISAIGYNGILTGEGDKAVSDGGGAAGGGGGAGGGGDEGAPPLDPIVSNYLYPQVTAGGKTAPDTVGETIDTGTEWVWPLATGEELTAYFKVVKTAEQTIELGDGGDVDKVTLITEGEADGTTAGLDAVVVKVDMEDLLFDGTDENGEATRTFKLKASEEGKAPVSITVNLKLTLPEDTTIYHKEDGKWTRIEDAGITEDIRLNNYRYKGPSGTSTTAANKLKGGYLTLTAGPVKTLQDAIAWVDTYAQSGTGTGLVPESTAGYSEYRIFIKRDELIGRINLKFNTADYVSLELYGAGLPGKMERNVKLNKDWSLSDNNVSFDHILNFSNGSNNKGLITIPCYTSTSPETRYRIFALGKNITLDGDNIPMNSEGDYAKGGISYTLGYDNLIWVDRYSTFIMGPHSKLTGANGTSGNCTAIRIITKTDAGSGPKGGCFYMLGGEISGNKVSGTETGAVIYVYGTSKTIFAGISPPLFIKEKGTKIINNTNQDGTADNRMCFYIDANDYIDLAIESY